MTDDRVLAAKVRAALGDCLSGVDQMPSLRHDIMRKARGERVVKKKLSVGLVFMIVMILVVVTALAAVLLSGKAFVQDVLGPKAQENQSQSWTEEEVAEILRIAGENGLFLSDAQQAQLLEGGGYYKEELMRLFVKLDLGFHLTTWSIEDQAWYSQMLVDIGLADETFNTLPEEGEVTAAEVLAIVQAYVHAHYDPEAPLADETVFRRHFTYNRSQDYTLTPDNRLVQEKRWFILYESLDLAHPSYCFWLDTEGTITKDETEPGILSREELPAPEALLYQYWRLYGNYGHLEADTWEEFGQMARGVAAVYGFGDSEVSELLALAECSISQKDMQPEDTAMIPAEEEYIATTADDLSKIIRYQELPFGLEWGMTVEEALALTSANGLELTYKPPEESAGEGDGSVSTLYNFNSPLIPGFLLQVHLVFFPLDAPGYDDGQLRLHHISSFDLALDINGSDEARLAKQNEVIAFAILQFGESLSDDAFVAVYGRSLQDDYFDQSYWWRFNGTVLLVQTDRDRIYFNYQNQVSLRE